MVLLPGGNGKCEIISFGDCPELMFSTNDGLSNLSLLLSSGGNNTAQGTNTLGDPGHKGGKPSLISFEGLDSDKDIINGSPHAVNYLDEMNDIVVQSDNDRGCSGGG